MDVKDPKTIEEQIRILVDVHNCVIEDEVKARLILESLNYYRLSPYFLTFKESNSDKYISGTTLDKAYELYQFDQLLRKIIEYGIESIETMIKTKIAYFHSLEFGPLGYMNSANYNSKFKQEEFDNEIEKYKNRNKETLVVKHHNSKYDGKFPFWVMIEFYDFGFMSKTYSQLHTRMQKKIASSLNTNSSCLVSWLYCLTTLRNICAHGSRLYNKVMVAVPQTPKKYKFKLKNTLFSYIMIIKELIYRLPEWQIFKELLFGVIDKYISRIDLSKIGFPTKWKDILNAAE